MNKNTRTHKALLFSTTLALIVFLTGCNTVRRTIREPLKEQGSEFLFSNLKSNELKYSRFSARFSASFTRDKNETSFSGQIRIQKDSLIWISISPVLGIEMARAANIFQVIVPKHQCHQKI